VGKKTETRAAPCDRSPAKQGISKSVTVSEQWSKNEGEKAHIAVSVIDFLQMKDRQSESKQVNSRKRDEEDESAPCAQVPAKEGSTRVSTCGRTEGGRNHRAMDFEEVLRATRVVSRECVSAVVGGPRDRRAHLDMNVFDHLRMRERHSRAERVSSRGSNEEGEPTL
jgi:hypothetical protein